MGHEFNIRLRESDIHAIAADPRGISLQDLLRGIPCFRGSSEDGTTFFYCTDEPREGRWQSYIVIKDDRLEFCSYSGEDYRSIVYFLLHRLIDLCGRFEIEDA